jgi:multisubunit Na+/H+ antiporter MnhB subunit
LPVNRLMAAIAARSEKSRGGVDLAAPGITKVPPLFDIVLSRMALRAVSIVLGGVGMFCLFMSFAAPDLAAQALVLIAAAGAIVHFCKE